MVRSPAFFKNTLLASVFMAGDSSMSLDTPSFKVTLTPFNTFYFSVLLMASLAGGLAWRGLFTGAIAETFKKVDGKSDIYDMFGEAVKSMEPHQTAELRSSLKKDLILPPAVSN